MREPEPETQIMEIAELERQIVGLVHDVVRTQGRVLVEEEGAPVAALVSLDDYRRLKRLDEQVAERRRVLDEIREVFRDVPADELERETARAVAEVKAEMRAERAGARRT